jgi:hypothetical protein
MFSLSKMDMGVEKILNVDVCTDSLIIDDSFYEFGNEELSYMENEARNKSKGVNVMDLGCGLVEVSVPLTVLKDLPELETATPKRVKEIVEQTIESIGTAVAQFGSPEDGPTMEANLNTQSVLSFPKIIMRLVITPKVVTLYQISHQTINDIILEVSDGYDFSKASRTFFDYVSREALAALLEIVFNKVKKELIKLITRVATKIIKEKLGIYLGSIAGIYLSKVTGAIESIEPPLDSGLVDDTTSISLEGKI